jgi:hypothetical protein
MSNCSQQPLNAFLRRKWLRSYPLLHPVYGMAYWSFAFTTPASHFYPLYCDTTTNQQARLNLTRPAIQSFDPQNIILPLSFPRYKTAALLYSRSTSVKFFSFRFLIPPRSLLIRLLLLKRTIFANRGLLNWHDIEYIKDKLYLFEAMLRRDAFCARVQTCRMYATAPETRSLRTFEGQA